MSKRKKKNHRDFQRRSLAAKRGWETRRINEIKKGKYPRKVLEARIKQLEEKLEREKIKREVKEYRTTLENDPELLRGVIADRLQKAVAEQDDDDLWGKKRAIIQTVNILHLEMREWELEPYDEDIGEIWGIVHEEGISP